MVQADLTGQAGQEGENRPEDRHSTPETNEIVVDIGAMVLAPLPVHLGQELLHDPLSPAQAADRAD
jgi:hypothetical protein